MPPRRSTELVAGRTAVSLFRRTADLLVLLLTGWLLWPQRHGGYGLGHDMVFTPHQPLNAGSLGLGSASPRAVPLDALVALAGKLLGGQLVGRLALAVPLLLAGWGLIRLVQAGGGCRLPALLLAGGFAVWNPFVVERLALGQWALLWCYGALPWLVLAGWRIRQQPDRWCWAGVGCALAACAITPTGALIGAAVLLAVGWSRRGPGNAALLGLAVAAQLPWLLPALTSTASATSDPRAVTAFAARAERPGGPLGSLLGLGGIWNAEVTPASRAGLLGYLSTLAVVAALVVGVPLIRPRLLAVRLAWLAAAGLLLAVAATVPGWSWLLRWSVQDIPGAGLLRDGQKWLMPFVLLAMLSAALAADRLTGWLVERSRGSASFRGQAVVCAVAAAVLPLLLLPDGPATLRAPLSPVHYPAGWQQVADRVSGSSATVLVLPFASYRSFSWAPGRTVLDPAPRLLGPPVLVDDRLAVGSTVLAGEDPLAAQVRDVLAGGNPPELASQLAGLGIGWVVVEVGTPGPPLPDLGGLRQVVADPNVRLYQVPALIRPVSIGLARQIVVVGVDLLLALAMVVAAAALAGRSVVRLLHSPVTFRQQGRRVGRG